MEPLEGDDARAHFRNIFPEYDGDIFGTSGNMTQGIVYLSRMNRREPRRMPMSPTAAAQTQARERDDGFAAATPTTRRNASLAVKQKCARSLATLSERSEVRHSIARDGAVEALVKLAREEDVQIASSVAAALCNLSVEPDLRAGMIDGGAVGALGLLSRVNQKRVKQDCAAAVCNLSLLPGREGDVVRDGAVNTLQAVWTVSPGTTRVVARALHNLSCVPERFSKLEDVVACAIELGNAATDRRTEQVCIATLAHLICVKNNQARCCEEGAVHVLGKLARSNHADTRKVAAKAICTLSLFKPARHAVVDQRILPAVASMAHMGDTETRRHCMLTVSRLALDPANRAKVVDQGAVPCIVAMAATECQEIGQFCIDALRSLAQDLSSAPSLLMGGAVPTLIELAEAAHADRAREDCAFALCCLSCHSSSISKMLEQGAVTALIAMAKPHNTEATRKWCAFAFYNLSCSTRFREAVADAGALASVVALAKTEADLDTRRQCAAALWNFTSIKDVDAVMVIQALMPLFDDDDAQIKGLCAAAMYNLAGSAQHCRTLMGEGVVDTLLQLARSRNTDTKVRCAAVLSRLAFEPSCRVQLMRDGLVRGAEALARMKDPETQYRCVTILYAMTCEASVRARIVADGVVRVLVALSSLHNERVRQTCAAALCNLSKEPANEVPVAKSGGVSALLIIALVASDSDVTKRICAFALANLLCNERNLIKMVNEGVVWGLVALARGASTHEMSRVCAMSLCNLAHKFPSQMIKAAVAHAIRSFLQIGTAEFMRMAGGTVYNMLFAKASLQYVVRQGGFKWINRLAATGNPEMLDLSMGCWCLLSADAPTRAAMVAAGPLELIAARAAAADERQKHLCAVTLRNLATAIVLEPPPPRAEPEGEGAGEVAAAAGDDDDQDEDARARSRARARDEADAARRRLVSALSSCKVLLADVVDDALEAVAEALHNLSAAPSNVPVLADEHISLALGVMLEREPVPALLRISADTIFNLSCCAPAQARLVNDGVIKLCRLVWELASEGEQGGVMRVVAVAATNFACGPVNSARVIADGSMPLLLSVAHDDAEELAVRARVAAAFRNALSPAGSREAMVEAGVIPALIKLSAIGDEGVSTDCAAALCNISYSRTTRAAVIDSGALASIIMSDKKQQAEASQAEDLGFGTELMAQIEAESWSNGSRGTSRMGRARAQALPPPHDAYPTPPIDHDAIGLHPFQLDWRKFSVDVDIEEHLLPQDQLTPTMPVADGVDVVDAMLDPEIYRRRPPQPADKLVDEVYVAAATAAAGAGGVSGASGDESRPSTADSGSDDGNNSASSPGQPQRMSPARTTMMHLPSLKGALGGSRKTLGGGSPPRGRPTALLVPRERARRPR